MFLGVINAKHIFHLRKIRDYSEPNISEHGPGIQILVVPDRNSTWKLSNKFFSSYRRNKAINQSISHIYYSNAGSSYVDQNSLCLQQSRSDSANLFGYYLMILLLLYSKNFTPN